MSKFTHYAVRAWAGYHIWIDTDNQWTCNKEDRKLFLTVGHAFEHTTAVLQHNAMTHKPRSMCGFCLIRVTSETKIETRVTEDKMQ